LGAGRRLQTDYYPFRPDGKAKVIAVDENLDPRRNRSNQRGLTWSILISFATAFLSLAILLLSVFDIAGSRHE
jgi:hypothetical protein